MIDLTEEQREKLHHKLIEYWAQTQRNNERGVSGYGLYFTEPELAALLRLTRACAHKRR